MQRLPLNALRAFALVHSAGGIRPAARELGITHSAVSRHVRELEAFVGVPLVEAAEGMRSLRFTPEGDALGRAAVLSLRNLEIAVDSAREARRANSVTVVAAPSFAARWLLPRLPCFTRTFPRIEVSVIAEQRVGDPEDQGADIAVRMGRGPWPGLDCLSFMDDALYPVVGRELWEQAGHPATMAELARLGLLHDRDPNASWALWNEAYPSPGWDMRGGSRFTSSDLVLRAAVQGLGVALARHRLAADDVAAGLLVRPFGDAEISLPDAYWIVRAVPKAAGARWRGAVVAVVDWLKEQGGDR